MYNAVSGLQRGGPATERLFPQPTIAHQLPDYAGFLLSILAFGL